MEGKGQRRREKRKKIGKRQGSTEAAYFKRLVKPSFIEFLEPIEILVCYCSLKILKETGFFFIPELIHF